MEETLVNAVDVEEVTEGAMDATNDIPEVLNQPVPTGMSVAGKVGVGLLIGVATVGICFGVKKGIKWFKNRKAKKEAEAEVVQEEAETTASAEKDAK